MDLLKTMLKRLRNRLLIKVLEKQDELSVKVEGLTDTGLAELAKVRRAVEETGAVSANKQDAAELKTELGMLKGVLDADVSANRQNAAALKTELGMLKTLLTTEAPQPVSLKTEKRLLNYLKALKGFGKRYMILTAIKDTTGVFLTDGLADGMRALGFEKDLSFERGLKKQHHHTYIGVIDRGEVVCEVLSKQREPSCYTAVRDGVAYEAVSKSFPEGNTAVIKIDDTDYAVNRRGLNIVVFDPVTRTVVDSVCFDTHAAALTCSRLEEIIENRVSQLNAISAAGYSAAQYLIDKQIKNIVVYTEERYWRLAEQLLMQLHITDRINVKGVISQMPFSRTQSQTLTFGVVKTSMISVSSLTQGDALVVVKPDADAEIAKSCAASVQILQLPTMLDEMQRWAFYDRPISDFVRRRPDVRLVSFNFPRFPWSGERSKNEQMAIDKGVTHENYFNALKQGWSTAYAEFDYSVEEIKEMKTMPSSYYDERGVRVYRDFSSKYVNTINGHRVTCFQPLVPRRTIWCVGGCNLFGVGSPDYRTIASRLQALCNRSGENITVENYGFGIWGHILDMYKTLNSIPVKDGDVVLILGEKPVFGNYPFIDLTNILQRPHDYGEVFTDTAHYNENGHRAIADALFKFLQEHSFFEEQSSPPAGAWVGGAGGLAPAMVGGPEVSGGAWG
ncbi:MAG: hypothetical protein LBH75_04975, partial [Treponema sp.]|nr:hypothetical protein [Treponema sp.]